MNIPQELSAFLWAIGPWVLGLLALAFAFYTTDEQNLDVVERLGKFHRLSEPGPHLRIPFMDRIVETLHLRVDELVIHLETKTKDNVFVKLVFVVQRRIIKEKAYEAYYKLEDPEAQTESYVLDITRAIVPTLTLDGLFESKEELERSVHSVLAPIMEPFGYKIEQVLLTTIDPADEVKQAMNRINAATRDRVAATEQGEAQRILEVKRAEASAQAMELNGKGIAAQRKAIAEGLKESADALASGSISADAAMRMILMTQYFDTLKELGAHGRAILVPHSPSAVGDLESQLRNSLVTAEEVARS